MSIEELIKEGSIHPFQATPEEINRSIEIARRDLSLAEHISTESLDWSYSIAYNSILQACRAYMFHQGYRPAVTEAHKATLTFMKISVEEPVKSTIIYFDRVRKKRHRTIYEEVGIVTEKDVEQLLKKAKEFLTYVNSAIKGLPA